MIVDEYNLLSLLSISYYRHKQRQVFNIMMKMYIRVPSDDIHTSKIF